MQARLVLGIVVSSVCLLGCASSQPVALDLHNSPVDPFADKSATAIVLVFVSNDCPICNRYAPEINRLYSRFTRQRIGFWLVHPEPGESSEDIARHARDYQLTAPELRDPKHELVQLANVDVVPSAAVFLPDRRLIYHGRIDDRFVELGRERPEALHRDLANVLEALVTQQPVPVTHAKAIGCYISNEQR